MRMRRPGAQPQFCDMHRARSAATRILQAALESKLTASKAEGPDHRRHGINLPLVIQALLQCTMLKALQQDTLMWTDDREINNRIE